LHKRSKGDAVEFVHEDISGASSQRTQDLSKGLAGTAESDVFFTQRGKDKPIDCDILFYLEYLGGSEENE